MIHKLYIDASLYKESICLRKVENILIHGWTERVRGFKMEYGTAFHKFCAAYRSGVQKELAIKLAIDHYSKPATQQQIGEDFRNSGHLFNTCVGYMKKYPLIKDNLHLLHDVNKNPLTEIKFKFPYLAEHIGDDTYEIILCGTIDSLNSHDSFAHPVICDIKSTASWDYKDYLNGYRMSPQLKFYKFIVERVAQQYPETFGMFNTVGCIIDGVFLKKDGHFFQRSEEILQFTEREMDEFESNLREFIHKLLLSLQMKYFPRNEVACESFPFGGCKFKQCCGASCGIVDTTDAAELELAYLEKSFVRGKYDPMLHGE